MYAIDLGFFPFAGLLAGGFLYAVYYWGMRLKCSARAGQTYIVLAMLVSTVLSVVSVARTTERDLPAVVGRDARPDYGMLWTVNLRQAAAASPADTAIGTPAVLQAPAQPSAPVQEQPSLRSQLRSRGEILFSNSVKLLGVLWLFGFVVVVLYFFVQLGYLYWFRHRQQRTGRDGRAVIYETAAGSLPFSFGRSVFVPAALSDEVRRYVLMHELSHVRHRHFLKLCLLELVLAADWWNPFVWLLFGEMRMQQEMEVDTDVLAQGIDRRQYQLSLVSVCTQQGRWLLMQQAFLGGPLKKRLLFMNTVINPRRAQVLIASTVAAGCMLLVVLLSVSCRARQRQKSHPLEGCWEMEWLQQTGTHYGHRYGNRNVKFFGDYGELTLTYDTYQGADITSFYIAGMDQRVHNDTLLDVHGRPIDYELLDGGDRLRWRWQILPGEENDHPDGVDQTEQWRRIKPDPELTDMLHALSQADRRQADSHQMNGVWVADSVVVVYSDYTSHGTGDKPTYLLVSDPYYMRIEFLPSVTGEVWNFAGNGDCGHFTLTNDGILQLQLLETYAVGSPDADHLDLSIRRYRGNADAEGGVWHYHYHRVPMPDYVRRMFRPALFAN